MANPMICKLEHGASLTDEDKAVLEAVCAETRRVPPRVDLIEEGENPRFVQLVLDGFACRYKMLSDGRRSIVAYLVPGDFCDLHVAILGQMDHSIATVTGCTMVQIPYDTVEKLVSRHPRIARALWWATLVDEAVLREWLVNLGRRTAARRLAHLFCELRVRLMSVAHDGENGFHFPFTQEELSHMLGVTPVHVNRVLQQLREDGLILLEDKMLGIPDVARLEAFAEFDATYLHRARRTPEFA